jgi:hypothetical protein
MIDAVLAPVKSYPHIAPVGVSWITVLKPTVGHTAVLSIVLFPNPKLDQCVALASNSSSVYGLVYNPLADLIARA